MASQPEHGSSKVLRNVGIPPHHYTVLHKPEDHMTVPRREHLKSHQVEDNYENNNNNNNKKHVQ
jgi:hypothetical protein